MTFKEHYDKVEPDQQRYLVAKALGGTERGALRAGGGDFIIVDKWEKESEDFVACVDMIKRGEAVKDALSIWVGERLLDFLKELERLATGDTTNAKVKLDALKYCIGLASNGSMKLEVQQTLMEKYVLDKAEVTLTKTLKQGSN